MRWINEDSWNWLDKLNETVKEEKKGYKKSIYILKDDEKLINEHKRLGWILSTELKEKVKYIIKKNKAKTFEEFLQRVKLKYIISDEEVFKEAYWVKCSENRIRSVREYRRQRV